MVILFRFTKIINNFYSIYVIGSIRVLGLSLIGLSFIGFVALQCLSLYSVCRFQGLAHYSVCRLQGLWHYRVCRIIGFVALQGLSFIGFGRRYIIGFVASVSLLKGIGIDTLCQWGGSGSEGSVSFYWIQIFIRSRSGTGSELVT